MVRTLTGKHPMYYEAVLQLRDISQDVVDYVEKVCCNGDLKVAKVVELKTGLDYFLSDNELTRALGKQLQKRWQGIIPSYGVISSYVVQER
jgi:NMD protein affecting ribosome stability and mRNA decay